MYLKQALLPALGLFALAPGSSLSAAETTHGGQVSLAFPTGDMKDRFQAKTGFTLGLNSVVDFKNGHALRPRLDFMQSAGKQQAFEVSIPASGSPFQVLFFTGGATVKTTALSVGVDYLYYVSGATDQGLYLVAGTGVSFNRATLNVAALAGGGLATAYGSGTLRSTAPYLNAGLGYQFNKHFGVEAGYRFTRIASQDMTLSVHGAAAGQPFSGPFTQAFEAADLKTFTLAATLRF